LPRLRRIAALCNASDAVFANVFLEHIQVAGKALQVDIVPVMVTSGPELDAAFPATVAHKVEAVIVQGSLVSTHVADLALGHRLPTVAPTLSFPMMGGLMAYTGAPEDNIRGAAALVDKILKGAKPADLPVQQPAHFRLVINLKTAKTLGLTIPPSIFDRADEVIE
jgi:putative tryptophan/tyrosine transport system substrate-binding protein